MTLAAGTRLGKFEIRGLIGKGGMGEVYRARDTKLERDVALKLLPENYARDPERVARFKREAELLASLNHPNIAAIYGVDHEGDRHYLVMEMVEGATLAERIHPSRAREQAVTSASPSPVPLEESLDIAMQICEALEHAHEKNIIHRDLKPANVKVTPEGLVKVLDFGLAKAFAGAASPSDSPTPAPPPVIDSNSPTLSKLPAGYGEISVSPSLPGVILGTAAYMSPEQAKGKTVDRRTDIWALGCVLYELLTGHGAFRSHPNRARQQAVKQSPERPLPLRGGETPERRGRQPHGVASPTEGPLPSGRGSDTPEPDTVQEIIANILKGEPDWTLLPADTPANLRFVLRRCLTKDPRQCFRDAADVRIQIEETLSAPAPSPTVLAPPVSRGKTWLKRAARDASDFPEPPRICSSLNFCRSARK
ncbi:MAG: serine/threonine protein kinase [Acidobacteria bacterium]|nr:serine/threonine protein kinase [Acidobacteriota bacterium]